MIHVEELTKVYQMGDNEVRALDGVDFTITKGEMVAIMGPSGSGKSTLLKLLNALYLPNSGTILFEGKTLTEELIENGNFAYDFRQRVAFLFQDPETQLFSSTVFEEICYGPLQLRWDKQRINEIAQQMMKQFGIDHLADRPPFRLSVGEKKKVALASVLALDPEVLLLDEPSMGLAPILVETIFSIIRTINAEGTTILLVEQNARQALAADHEPAAAGVYTLSSGRIGLAARGAGAAADNVSAAALFQPKTDRAPTPQPGAGLAAYSDEFDGSSLGGDWTWVREDPDAAVRLRVPDEGDTSVEDEIRGEVHFPNESADDFVIARGDGSVWAVVDGREVHGGQGPVPERPAVPAPGLRLNCLALAGGTVVAGTAEAHLLRLEGGELRRVDPFDRTEGRDGWYTPWGGPPDVRSIAVGSDGALWVNVHVGGIPTSADGGLTWRPTIEVDADVHQEAALDLADDPAVDDVAFLVGGDDADCVDDRRGEELSAAPFA